MGGQRMLAFVVTILALNGTLALATFMQATADIANHVIEFESIAGIVLLLGRTGVHIAEAWATRGKPQ